LGSDTLSLDFGGKTAGLNVAVRPKPDWFMAELIIAGVSRVGARAEAFTFGKKPF
jgi:hypothetical protein